MTRAICNLPALIANLAISLTITTCVGCTHRQATQRAASVSNDGADAAARQLWDVITEAAPQRDLSEYDNVSLWWLDVAALANYEFWTACLEPDWKTSLEFVIRQFGKHGALADMRLLFTEPEVMFPGPYDAPGLMLPRATEWARLNARVRAVQLEAARIWTKLLLKRPDLLRRYYNVLVWSKEYFRGPPMHMTILEDRRDVLQRRFTGNSCENYWWYAREFVILAFATQRDDLLQDVEASELFLRYTQWNAWINTNWDRLIADGKEPVWNVLQDGRTPRDRRALRMPMSPFPDWNADAEVPLAEVIWYMKLIKLKEAGAQWISEDR